MFSVEILFWTNASWNQFSGFKTHKHPLEITRNIQAWGSVFFTRINLHPHKLKLKSKKQQTCSNKDMFVDLIKLILWSEIKFIYVFNITKTLLWWRKWKSRKSLASVIWLQTHTDKDIFKSIPKIFNTLMIKCST